MSRPLHELRHALRRLARRPLFAVIAVVTLAIGIGANTAIFSLLYGVVLRRLPMPEPGRVVFVGELAPDGGVNRIGFQTYADLAEQSKSFARLAAVRWWTPSLALSDGARTIDAQRVSAGYLRVLGVAPALGRDFTADDDRPGAPHVVLLSNRLWREQFGADPEIVGRTVPFTEVPYQVVGVLPRSLDDLLGPGSNNRLDAIAPLRYERGQPWACRDCRHLQAIGRLAPGVDVTAARAELDAMFARLRDSYPTLYPTDRGALQPLDRQLAAAARPMLTALFAGVALVLLLAAANIAALFAVRAVERSRELALRRSLGAESRDVVASAWSEPLVITVAGGLVGVLAAPSLLRLLIAAAPIDLPRIGDIGLATPVLAFAAVVSVVVALAAGLAPALVYLRTAPRDLLAAGRSGPTRGGRRAMAFLVVAELALALVVVFAAGLVGRSLDRLLSEELGFDPRGVTTLRVVVGGPHYETDEAIHAFFDRALERVLAVPGVATATWTTQLPLSGDFDRYSLRFADRPEMKVEEEPDADRFAVTPGYFPALGLRLVMGRLLDESDGATSEPVVLLNRTLAETIWPHELPLGKRIHMGGDDSPWRTVVGVVEDVRNVALDRPSAAQIYVPEHQWDWADGNRALVVRSPRPSGQLGADLRDAVRSVDATQPIGEVLPMPELIARSAGSQRFAAGLWSSFAALALLLAGLGTYGLLTRQIALRVREFGVRSALGAPPGQLAGQVGLGVARLLAAAIALAVPATLLIGRLLASQLWQTPASDPPTLALSTTVVCFVALGAALLPAWRAARVDPVEVLREEG